LGWQLGHGGLTFRACHGGFKTKRRRRYSTEFKIEAVQESLDGEGRIRAVAVGRAS
jgi:hypothetical protein